VTLTSPSAGRGAPGPLHLDAEELVACVACGLCLPHCPTYRATGLEIASPRGRIAAMRLVELEGAPIDDAFTTAMNECVQCRGCEVACPSSVQFGHLMEDTRAALYEMPRRGSPATASFGRRAVEWLGYRLP
jgi:glycolate oxidase iron-sulfur subunit